MTITEIVSMIAILAQVTFLEGVLSLDNAAVLGAMVQRLPADAPIPWPTALAGLGRRLHRLLGMQRTAALRVGLLGAYLGRGLMLLLASFVVRNPWLQLIGALYLLKVSVSELAHLHQHAEHEAHEDRLMKERGFWATVLTVELLDLAFSLDNVVVVITLSNELWLIMVGVALGILTMRFAAGVFAGLIEKIPAIGPAAYVLVFNIGVEFILGELGVEISEAARFGLNIGVLLAAVVYSKVPFVQRLCRQPFRMFGMIFHGLDWIFTILLFPFTWLFQKLVNRSKPEPVELPPDKEPDPEQE
jgi:tellurite resistance protein TerC